MLVLVDESAIRDITSQSPTAPQSHASLGNLLAAHYEGYHILCIAPEHVEQLQPFASDWSKQQKRALLHVQELFPQIDGLRQELPWSLVVGRGSAFDGKTRCADGRREIYVDLGSFNKMQAASDALLLGENKTDADLYHELGKLRCLLRLGDQVEVVVEARGGGGDTTAVEFENAARRGRILLAIGDGDRRHPKSGVGNTYKKLEQAARKTAHGDHQRVKELHVRTAEALVPLDVFEFVFDQGKQSVKAKKGDLGRLRIFLRSAPADILKYAHLKDGIVLFQAHHPARENQAEGDYWTEIAKKVKRAQCMQGTPATKKAKAAFCTKREQCKCYVVDALGPHALESVVKWLQSQKTSKQRAQQFHLGAKEPTPLTELTDEIVCWGLALRAPIN